MSNKGKQSWNAAVASSLSASIVPGTALPVASKKTRAQRSVKAKKFFGDSNKESYDEFDGMPYAAMCRIDRLANSFDLLQDVANGGEDDGEDDYDELDELGGGGAKNAKKKRKRAAAPAPKGGAKDANKAFKVTPLSTCLMDDSTRSMPSGGPPPSLFYTLSLAPKSSKPMQHLCPVTNLPTKYKDPASQIRYATVEALDVIRENYPSWVKNLQQGGIEYYEAVGSLRKVVRERVARGGDN
jgi:hypothetical protein